MSVRQEEEDLRVEMVKQRKFAIIKGLNLCTAKQKVINKLYYYNTFLKSFVVFYIWPELCFCI